MSWSFPVMLAVSVGCSVFTLPFASAFTRAQTTYAPVGEDGNSDGTLIQQVGLRTSPWAQLKSAWSGRGVRGLFQGLYLQLPHFLLDALVQSATDKYFGTDLPTLGYHLPLQHLLSVAYLPSRVLSTTVIVDPSAFNTWNPFEALRRLAFREQGGLWCLWTSRRYLQAVAVELVLDLTIETMGILLLRISKWAFVSFSGKTSSGKLTFNKLGYLLTSLGGQAVVSAGAALLCSVLFNILNRLQVSSGAYLPSSTHYKESDYLTTDAPTKVVLRSRPYTGVWDCVTSVIHEEGWQALFRGAKEFVWIGVGFAGTCALAGIGIGFWGEEAMGYVQGLAEQAAKEKREGDVRVFPRSLPLVDYHRSFQQV